MTTNETPNMPHFSCGEPLLQPTPCDYTITEQPVNSEIPAQRDEKSQGTIQSAVVECQLLIHDQTTPKTYYVPTGLRTGFLVAFCLITLTVFALLQVASAAYLGAHGLESLAVYTSNAKRAAYPQTSDPVCSPGATCAPAPSSWKYPSNSTVSPPEAGAPPPGSWTSAGSMYLLGAYVPTLVAIFFSVWWKCVLVRLKEMEPYYQLTKPGGAKAKDSLSLSYSSTMLPLVLIKSFRSRHELTLTGALNMMLITLCTMFAAETLHLKGVGDGCGVIVDAKGKSNKNCEMQLAMQPALGFVLGVVLLAVFLATSLILFKLRRHPSGLFTEATSIAGIASLSTSTLAKESSQSLQDPSRRFALVFSEVNNTNSIAETTSAPQHHASWPSAHYQSSISRPKRESHWELHTASLVLFLSYQIGILVMVLYYRYVSKPGTNDPLEDFMNSEGFGVRIFMTILGLGTKFYWGWIEKRVRTLSPYVALSSPHGATAQESVLMKSHGHPVTALFDRSTWKHSILGPVTLMATLTEVLVIMLNTVPFTRTTAYTAFQVSVYISTIILALMILTTPAVLLWSLRIRKTDDIPNVPECIADLFQIVGNQTCWRTLSVLEEERRDKRVERWGVRFGMRKVQDKWRLVIIQ